MESEADFDPNSTPPKLSFHSLPSKPPPPPGLLTPPLQTLVSIPFQWEEAPGKPRRIITTTTATAADTTDTNLPPSTKSKAARCLELPPRLFIESSKVVNVDSPKTVFEGPEDGRRSLSHTFSFSLGGGGEEKVGGCGGGGGKNLSRSGKIREKSFRLSSWRWGSFKDSRGASVGSFDFSSNSYGGGGGGSGRESGSFFEDDSKVKMTRSVRRGSSFMGFSNSRIMARLYGGFKQAVAVPWRRRN